MSVPVTWTESYKSFIEIEIPPLFATSREAAIDYVKKAVRANKVDIVGLAFDQQLSKDSHKECVEFWQDLELGMDDEKWWGPW